MTHKIFLFSETLQHNTNFKRKIRFNYWDRSENKTAVGTKRYTSSNQVRKDSSVKENSKKLYYTNKFIATPVPDKMTTSTKIEPGKNNNSSLKISKSTLTKTTTSDSSEQSQYQTTLQSVVTDLSSVNIKIVGNLTNTPVVDVDLDNQKEAITDNTKKGDLPSRETKKNRSRGVKRKSERLTGRPKIVNRIKSKIAWVK